MELLYFSLIFVTLILLAGILYSRLGRYEAYLRDLQGIKTLNDRLGDLVDGLEGLKTRRVEDQIHQIQETLEQIRVGLERQAGRAPVVQEIVQRAAPVPILSLQDVVESKLYNMGYQQVHIVSDLSEANSEEPLRIIVEARKDGTIHKGHLVLNGQSVTELDIQPVFGSFP